MLKRSSSALPVGMFALATALATAPALAASAEGESWQFEATPYIFASGVDGTVGVRGVTADVDISFNDILDNLDSAFMGVFQAKKGRWTFGLDVMYSKIEVDGSRSWQGPLGSGNDAALDMSYTMGIYQPFVGYRVLDERSKVDLIAGARYTRLSSDVSLTLTTGANLLPDGSRSVSGDVEWWDGVVGVKVIVPIADKWAFAGYADVGGGGSDLTYQALAGVNWQFAKDYSAKFGYRYLSQDYEDDGIVWDVALSGIFLGLGIAF